MRIAGYHHSLLDALQSEAIQGLMHAAHHNHHQKSLKSRLHSGNNGVQVDDEPTKRIFSFVIFCQ